MLKRLQYSRGGGRKSSHESSVHLLFIAEAALLSEIERSCWEATLARQLGSELILTMDVS